jgi:hypothetical protein
MNDIKLKLPNNFQTTAKGPYGFKLKAWSFLDSCSSNIQVPVTIFDQICEAVVLSGGLPSSLTKAQHKAFVNGDLLFKGGLILWRNLPKISIEIKSTSNNVFQLIIGPFQYIQQDSKGRYQFLISAGADEYAILGLPIYSAFYIVVDRDTGIIGFSLGCGCKMIKN